MSRNLHLVNRNGVFCWRRRLPGAIATAFGRAEIVISLRCREPKKARLIAGILSVHFDHFIHRMHLEQRLPTAQEQQEILQELYRYVIDNCHTERAQRIDAAEISDVRKLLPTSLKEDFLTQEDNEWLALFRHQSKTAKDLRVDYANGAYELVRAIMEPFLTARQIDARQDNTDFRKFLGNAALVGAQAFDDGAAETTGEMMPTALASLIANMRSGENLVRPLARSGHAPDQLMAGPAKPAEPPLSSFIDGFLAETFHETNLVNSTKGQKRIAVSLLLRILGDRPLCDIGRADAQKLMRTLEKLPSVLGKSSRHKKMSIQEIIDQSPPGYRTMSRGTLDRHWQNILAFLKWVNRQDGVARADIAHIFGGLKWGKDVPEGEERETWGSDSIRHLFASPIWLGFQPHPEKRYWRHEPGETVIRDEYWWLPLLSVYHGARLEELSELRGSDVHEHDGVVLMRLRGGHVKSDGSNRDVPIHSAIIRLGFVDLALKAGEEYIFPKMLRAGTDHKRGHEFSGRFTQYRKKIGVYQQWMDFHSFRHNVTTQIMNADLNHSKLDRLLIADELTGHESKNRKEHRSETLTYFHGFDARLLKQVIECVHYPEIDIDRLLELSASSEEFEGRLATRLPDVWGDNPKPRTRTKKKKSVPTARASTRKKGRRIS